MRLILSDRANSSGSDLNFQQKGIRRIRGTQYLIMVGDVKDKGKLYIERSGVRA